MFCYDNHLSTHMCPIFSSFFKSTSAPTKFGFLACGVYQRSTHSISQVTRLCGTFKDFSHSKTLGQNAAVIDASMP